MPVNNNSFQKNANTSLVAQLIWKRKCISRVDIARELSLYRSTVSNIISYLLNAGVVCEGEHMASHVQGGRKAIEISLNNNFGCVFGFDIQPSHYRAVLLAMDGSVLWSETGSFGLIPLEQMVDTMVEHALEVHHQFNIPILALSFSIPGIVDSENGIINYSEPFKLTEAFDLRAYVKAKHNYPVYVENDANCAAWMDIYSKGHALENALSVVGDFHEESKKTDQIIGIGTGFGIIIDGTVYRGAHNASGEFCSISWAPGNPNQSGLDIDVLRKTADDKQCLEQWIEDTFRSFVPLCSVMDFEKVILHGNPFKDEMWVREVLQRRAAAFLGALEKSHTELLFDANDECISAKGAAIMYLHYLFSVPDLESSNSEWMGWDELIEFSKAQMN